MKAITAPLITLGLLLTLSFQLKPAGNQQVANRSCKVINQEEQSCLVVFKHYERTSRGWTMYLEGNSGPLQVQTTNLPVVQLHSALQVTLQDTPGVGLQLTDWSKVYSPSSTNN